MVNLLQDPWEYASAAFAGKNQLAVTEAEQREIGQLGHPISFPAKATVFIEGEPAVAVYKLTRGTAVLYKAMADGRKQIVDFALPGDFLNSPLANRNSCSVDAISEVTVCQFPRLRFLTFLAAHPTSLRQMLEASSA